MSGLFVAVGDEGHQRAGDMSLAGMAETGFMLLAVDHADGVVFAVEADAGVGHVIGDDHIEILVAQLARGVLQQILGLCGDTAAARSRSRESRVGKAREGTCRSRWSQ